MIGRHTNLLSNRGRIPAKYPRRVPTSISDYSYLTRTQLTHVLTHVMRSGGPIRMAISKVSSGNRSVLDYSAQEWKSSAQLFWQDLRRNKHRDAANSPPTLECLLSVCDGHSFKQSSQS